MAKDSAIEASPAPGARAGLRGLAAFEVAKGLLALGAAGSLEALGTGRLQETVGHLILRFNLDPEHGPLPALLHRIDPGAVQATVALLALYALWRLAEGWGLWRGRAWASWLGCIGTAGYLPVDVYALWHHPGWHAWAVLGANLLVAAYLALHLYRRRRRPRRSGATCSACPPAV